MKKVLFAIATMLAVVTANAQEKQETKVTSGDYYEGYTKKVSYDRMIPPYGLEVTFDKTVCAHKGE